MKILIPGGTGLIGRALSVELVAAGHEVTVLSRTPGRFRPPVESVHAAEWNGTGPEGIVEPLEEADAVVHLVGAGIADKRWSTSRKRILRRSRIDSILGLVEAMGRAKNPPTVLLQASAVGYYGLRGEEEVSETGEPGSDFLASLSREWEAAGAGAEQLGVRRIVARTGIVLSRDGGALPRMLLPFRFFLGGPLGDGNQWMPWIHMADEVGAMRYLLEDQGARGAFNLTAPTAVTNREFGRILGAVIGRPAFMPAPAFALRLALGEMSDLLLTGRRVRPNALLERGYEFRFDDLEGALRDLL